jgi:hypothetical protein
MNNLLGVLIIKLYIKNYIFLKKNFIKIKLLNFYLNLTLLDVFIFKLNYLKRSNNLSCFLFPHS